MKYNEILDSVKNITPKLVAHRRQFHANPELSFHEHETAKYIKAQLDSMGIENHYLIETGVVGIIGKGDICVALRADIDALPITEENDLPFKSRFDGKMHACGHDFHAAMLLGAAEILKANEDKLGGTVKLIFQPAEELIPGGAFMMIQNGVLKNPAPQAVFGQHVNPGDNLGCVSLAEGGVMASGEEFYFTIKGKGSHAAQPHLGNDPILAAANVITYLQTLTNKHKNPINPGVISITAINGGSVTNVFPDEVKLMGTMRSYDQSWREEMYDKIEKGSKAICEVYDTECELVIKKGFPAVRNNAELTNLLRTTSRSLFGEDRTMEFEPKMWAEDFGYFSQELPSVFWYIGVKPPDMPEMPPIHNAKFNPSEEALPIGCAMLVAGAIDFLTK